ncbi:MAG: DUF5009 domain-containing protein [Planctomycetes bacterium]|nr:DUF5009 domain-containing protein [Planctomycetota bacterium]
MSAAPASRWLGLDALRGLTIAAMILVNNPGDWGHIHAPLKHAEWHGCTPTDLIFPTFLFVAGVAIVPALQRARERGIADAELIPRILKRMLLLLGIGMFLSAFPLITFAAGKDLFDPLWTVRFPGVLQRIGVCYAIAAILFLRTTERMQRAVLVGCLAVYWPLIELIPVPGHGFPDIGDHRTHMHLPGWMDRRVFGSHTWGGRPYDPEGLLSTIPAVATALLGVQAGRVLARPSALEGKVLELLLRGVLLATAGAVWGWFFPINKPLWTSSYVLWAGGLSTAALGVAVWAFEVKPWARWARPLQIYGVNALLVFVGSALLARVVGRLWTVTGGDGKTVSVQKWLYSELLASWADPYVASLLWAVLWISGWFVALAWLWRRGIVWKV